MFPVQTVFNSLLKTTETTFRESPPTLTLPVVLFSFFHTDTCFLSMLLIYIGFPYEKTT